MVETAYRISDRPSVVRYPRAAAYGAEVLQDLFNTELVRGELPSRGTALPIGKGRVVRRGLSGRRVHRLCAVHRDATARLCTGRPLT